ncbi:MAG: winged helix-turn-helix transcriptional regulator [Planctomycetaceae bacterium]|nr:winged helix-turn-helix transcriptional regulator [Planctomycetaceae bacterium]
MSQIAGKSQTVRRAAKFDSLEQEAYLQLWRSYDRLRAFEDELFARHDLSAQQYNALRLLQAVYPATLPVSAVGAKLISRAPDMTRLLDKLDERALVRRERKAANRRVVEVGVTDAGLTLLDALAAEVRACHERQLGHLGDDKLRELIAMLKEARRPHEEAAGPWARGDS